MKKKEDYRIKLAEEIVDRVEGRLDFVQQELSFLRSKKAVWACREIVLQRKELIELSAMLYEKERR